MQRAIRVLYEDNHLLIVDKESELATMGAREGMPSLLQDAKDYLKQKYQKPGNVYLGVVSRLDSFVSGVIVFARTSKAAARLAAQFASGAVSKTYWAIIPDSPKLPESGELEQHIYKDDRAKRMFISKRKLPNSQVAKLRFRTLARAGSERLIEITLLTGRKHQIRAQLAYMGSPIIGDRKYGSTVEFPKGIALHSVHLELEHPITKQRLKLDSLPPKYWQCGRFSLK
jgi:23S rRNA pseudouridine1911/1915/1917 synthase